ncbi:MAG: NADH-quinone oxidoreductase subunit NuoE [Rhodospirillales bacterium]|nr:NADH-quinone oxidoreductase subunit NuoE [Rhodospirillales bacterium]
MSNATTAPKPMPASFAFTDENRDKAAAIVARYPEGRQASAVMPLLNLAQRQNGGWVSRDVMDFVADYLDMPPMRVYEVATFYTMFNLKPIGRHHVQVCTNLPCWLRGSDEIIAACRRSLGIGPGQTTEDGAFTVSEVECLGACVNAPMMQIGDDYFEDLSPETAATILEDLRHGRTPKRGSQIGRRSCEPVGGLTTLTSLDEASGDEEPVPEPEPPVKSTSRRRKEGNA